MDICWQSNVSAFCMLSRLVITFLPRNKSLLTSSLQSPSTVILEPKKIKSVTVSTVSQSICNEVMGPDAMILVFWWLSFKPIFFTLLFHSHQETLQFLFIFCHESDIICLSEVVDISLGNLDSTLLFIQPWSLLDILNKVRESYYLNYQWATIYVTKLITSMLTFCFFPKFLIFLSHLLGNMIIVGFF